MLTSSPGFGHELLVLSGENSQNSKRWEKEVLPEYKASNSGQNLPVKIVPVKGNFFPDWLANALDDGSVGEIIGTPTFLIWDPKEKKEVGRIEGYTQKSRFFSQLTEAIDLVKQGQHPGKREGSGGHRDEGSGGDHRMDEGSGGHREEGSGNKNNIMDNILLLGAFSGLIFSIIFSSAEIALISSSKLQIDVWIRQKYKLGKLAKYIISRKLAFLNLILIGTTLSNILAASYLAQGMHNYNPTWKDWNSSKWCWGKRFQ